MTFEKVKKFLEKPFAHRGLHSGNSTVPENSTIAFQKAIDSNYAIELDICILADDEICVFHDDNLSRICGINQKIYVTTSKELKKLKLLGSENRIPLLKEVLNLVKGCVPILIELKNYGEPRKLEKLSFELLSNYSGAFAVQSFNPHSLGWFAKNAPDFLRGQISSDFRGSDFNDLKVDSDFILLLKEMRMNYISNPNFIAYDSSALPYSHVEELRERGLPVLAWTIRSNEEYNRVKNFCDNIIFENFMPYK